MKQFLFYTDDNLVGIILRVTIGLIMFPHGAQKMFGLFGGYGFKATTAFLTQTVGLPWLIAVLIILVEAVGSLCLIAGFGSRLWAVLLFAVMIGAISTTCYANGFFMNWSGNQKGEGFEYHLLVIGLCMAVFVSGSGRYSLDQLFRLGA